MFQKTWLQVVIVAMLLGRAAAVSGDDFTNNLASDTAPLLALFGDRFTLQFLSRSAGLSDLVALAIGPLGLFVITGSAVRLGGPPWLKGIIGRARENLALAEMEILSSTSSEVSELWNGNAIVRCMGSAAIAEFICVSKSFAGSANGVPKVETMSLEELVHNGYAEKTDMTLTESFRKRRAPSASQRQEEAGIPLRPLHPPLVVARNLSAEGPNLSLNVQSEPHKAGSRIVAISLALAQLGTVAFSWWSVYIAKWKKGEKDEQVEVDAASWPLYMVGTTLVLACTALNGEVVESSTKRKNFRIRSDWEARTVCLQKKQKVNDQSFDSYAIFTGKPKHVITTSRRADRYDQKPEVPVDQAHTSQHEQRPEALVDRLAIFILKLAYRIESFVSQLRGRTAPPRRISPEACAHFKAEVGSIGFFVGYPIQFMGWRGLHFSTALAHVGLTIFGWGLRSIISRAATKSPLCVKLQPGFELEWLTMTMGNMGQAPWVTSDDSANVSSAPGPNCEWGIMTGRRGLYPTLTPEDVNNVSQDENDVINRVTARSLMKIRRQNGKLADWQGPASGEAIMLAKAIETVMDNLFAAPTVPESFNWTLGAYCGSSKDLQLLRFGIKRKNGKWTVRADKLEAALSLWLYTAELSRRDGDPDPALQQHGNKDAWLRAKGATPKASVFLLGRRTAALHRDVAWWLPSGASEIKSLTRVPAPAEPANQGEASRNVAAGSTLEICNHRILGPESSLGDELLQPGRTKFNSSDLQEPKYDQVDPNTAGSGDAFLATVCYDSLKMVYARELFLSFMLSVAKRLEGTVGQDVKIIRDSTASDTSNSWRNFKMRSVRLDNLAIELHDLGLGSLQQVYECLIPPLSVEMKLAQPDALIELAREQAKEHELLGRWEDASDVYSWLLRTSRTYDHQSSVAVKALAVVKNFHYALSEAISFKRSQAQLGEALQQMESLEERLKAELASSQLGVLNSLECMYYCQKRPLSSPETLVAPETAQEKAFSLVGASPIHRLALSSATLGRFFTALRANRNGVHSKDVHHWTPLHYAAAGGVPGAVRRLIQDGADVNAEDISGWTALHYASCHGTPRYRQVLKELLDHGAEINLRGRDGRMPLHCAAIHGCIDTVETLIEFGGAMDVLDSSGYSPLLYAVIYGHQPVVEYLWLDANKWLRDRSGRTILHLMALNGRADILDFALGPRGSYSSQSMPYGSALLRHPGSIRNFVNVRDGAGESSLFLAVSRGHKEVVRLLLHLGANRRISNEKGDDLEQVATGNGFVEIAELLKFKGYTSTTELVRSARQLGLLAAP